MRDPLMGLFLAGLLGALAAWLAMARVVCRAGRLQSVGQPPAGDLLRDYLADCGARDRRPLLWYAYCASLGLGLAALILAFT
jgi:hypothetical protein